MGYIMNPQQVKRREYLGIAGLTAGLICGLSALAAMVYSLLLGLILLACAVAAFAAGIIVLSRIPDVAGATEDQW